MSNYYSRFPQVALDANSVYESAEIAFSICTVVNKIDEYAEMILSFQKAGFDAGCEYYYLNNFTANEYDLYKAINIFLNIARGKFVIICHQDILLKFDRREDLEKRLAELDEAAPGWGVCGNAGGVAPGKLAIRLTDPHGEDQREGNFPERVSALDENFILIKRAANLAVSSDLAGFHMYGTDICIIAELLGFSAHVIDFHLLHKSPGFRSKALAKSRADLESKYRHAFRSRWTTSTCEVVFLSGNKFWSWLNNTILFRKLRTYLSG